MKFLLSKILNLLVTLAVVLLLTFTAFWLLPGDAVIARLATSADPESVAAMRHALGLDLPFLARFGRFIKSVLLFDWGDSISYAMPVRSLIGSRLPVTLGLAGLTVVMSTVLAYVLAVSASLRPDGRFDRCVDMLLQFVMAVPPFFMCVMMSFVFGVLLKWITPGYYVSPDTSVGDFWLSLVFPAIAAALPRGAAMFAYLRPSIADERTKDYVRFAYAKGNSGAGVLVKHILKNASIPAVNYLALTCAEVLAGAIVVEQVFSLPGIGRLLVVSVSNRDIPVAQAIILIAVVTVVVINTLADVVTRALDPRMVR